MFRHAFELAAISPKGGGGGRLQIPSPDDTEASHSVDGLKRGLKGEGGNHQRQAHGAHLRRFGVG